MPWWGWLTIAFLGAGLIAVVGFLIAFMSAMFRWLP